MKMGKKESARWEHFGDMHSIGRSIPVGYFGSVLLAKWINAGLVRIVAHWEDSVQIAPNGTICEWNMGEVIATEKGLELL